MKNVLVTKPILRFIFLGANPGETITPIQKKLKQVSAKIVFFVKAAYLKPMFACFKPMFDLLKPTEHWIQFFSSLFLIFIHLKPV